MFRNRIAKAAAGVLAAAVLLAGCGGIDKTATLVTINGGEDTITLGYGNFAARTAQAQYDLVYRMFYGDSYWSQAVGEGTMETMVKEDVLTAIEDQYLLRQHAADYGVSLNEEQTDAIDSAVAEFLADNTKEGLAQLGAT